MNGEGARHTAEAIHRRGPQGVQRAGGYGWRHIGQVDDDERHQGRQHGGGDDRHLCLQESYQHHRDGRQRQRVGEEMPVVVGQDEGEIELGSQGSNGS